MIWPGRWQNISVNRMGCKSPSPKLTLKWQNNNHFGMQKGLIYPLFAYNHSDTFRIKKNKQLNRFALTIIIYYVNKS